MKGYSVYNAIQQLKERGFKKASVARQLNLNRRTVIRYWDMSVEEYEQKHLGLCREKALDTYCAATRFNQNRRHNTIREISFGEYKRFPGAELRETVIVKTPVH